MSAPRLLGLVAAVPLLAVGLAPASTATAADPAEAKAPTQLLQLTTSAGDGTAVAEAGLDEAASVASTAATEAPAATSGGSGVAPGRAALLATATTTVDPEEDATLLTDPIAVDDFLVAGFSWTGSAELPTGTQIYLRVREDGQWSDWYLNQASDAGRDDGTGLQGTDEFVTGGADAVQASVVSPSGELPADLNLAMVPGQPTGEEQVDASDLETVDAEPTDVAESDTTSSSSSALGPIAQQTDSPTAAATTAAQTSTGSTTGGSAISPAAATLLAATTTANSLPVAVTTRSEWGANESYMTWTPAYYEADHVVVHHTAGTNSYTSAQSASIVNGIYYYHAVTLGWGDIGYNFLVSKYGQVFEGRSGSLASAPGKMVAGGHALGVNNGTMGISMMGDFTSTSPTSAQLSAVGKMAGWFLGRQGITNAYGSSSFVVGSPSALIKYPKGSTQNFTYIFAHRDVNYTTCPGDVGYSKMGQIRSIAAAQATVTAGNAGSNPVGAFDTVSGGSGAVHVSGWAYDADSTTATAVRVSVDGTAYTVRASRSRTDVNAARADVDRDATGFVAAVSAPAGSHRVCVTAVNQGGGSSTSLGCKTVTVVGTTVIEHNGTGTSAKFGFGSSGYPILVGDWNGDGVDSTARQEGSTYLFRNKNADALTANLSRLSAGKTTDSSYAGDWDGDGDDELMLRRGNQYYVKSGMTTGSATVRTFTFGSSGSEVVVGDWDGDGKDTLALRSGNTYRFSNTLGSTSWWKIASVGRSTDRVVAGDWDGDGKDTLGFRRSSTFLLTNALASGSTSQRILWGSASDLPIAGDWNGDGKDTVGLVRNS